MKICAIYHVSFERLGFIEDWITQKRHELTEVFLYENQNLPRPDDFDMLITMGGSMGVNDEKSFPWLAPEKELIRNSINRGKAVLGICLGAQLIASALGSRVFKGRSSEIGWFPVRFNHQPAMPELLSGFPSQLTAFHWHGDTFDLPEGAIRLAQSENTMNQAFLYKKHVIGLQFHPEMKPENISLMINYGGDELAEGLFVQSARSLTDGMVHMPGNRAMLDLCLEYLENSVAQQKSTGDVH